MKLLRVLDCAESTCAFYFERPEGFDYRPGQFVEVMLDSDEPKERSRSFSIASAPCEPDLLLTTRLRDSEFKGKLRALPAGSDVKVEGPYGRFGLKLERPGRHVMIAGGIGITPFRSIIVQAAHDGLAADLILFHANRTLADAAFHEELLALDASSESFRFVPVLTRGAETWPGERGHIDASMLARYGPPQETTFYVVGPPPMVGATRDLLLAMGVERPAIVAEAFSGY